MHRYSYQAISAGGRRYLPQIEAQARAMWAPHQARIDAAMRAAQNGNHDHNGLVNNTLTAAAALEEAARLAESLYNNPSGDFDDYY